MDHDIICDHRGQIYYGPMGPERLELKRKGSPGETVQVAMVNGVATGAFKEVKMARRGQKIVKVVREGGMKEGLLEGKVREYEMEEEGKIENEREMHYEKGEQFGRAVDMVLNLGGELRGRYAYTGSVVSMFHRSATPMGHGKIKDLLTQTVVAEGNIDVNLNILEGEPCEMENGERGELTYHPTVFYGDGEERTIKRREYYSFKGPVTTKTPLIPAMALEAVGRALVGRVMVHIETGERRAVHNFTTRFPSLNYGIRRLILVTKAKSAGHPVEIWAHEYKWGKLLNDGWKLEPVSSSAPPESEEDDCGPLETPNLLVHSEAVVAKWGEGYAEVNFLANEGHGELMEFIDSYQVRHGDHVEMRYMKVRGVEVSATFNPANVNAQLEVTRDEGAVALSSAKDEGPLVVKATEFMVLRKICALIPTLRTVAGLEDYGKENYTPPCRDTASDKLPRGDTRFMNGEVTPQSIARMLHTIGGLLGAGASQVDVISPGCGDGDMAAFMVSVFDPAAVHLFDRVDASLRIARKAVEAAGGRDLTPSTHHHDFTDAAYMARLPVVSPRAMFTINNINFVDPIPALRALAATRYETLVGVIVESYKPSSREAIAWGDQGVAVRLFADDDDPHLRRRVAVFYPFKGAGIIATIPVGKRYDGSAVVITSA